MLSISVVHAKSFFLKGGLLWQALGWSVTFNKEKAAVKASAGPTSGADIFREAAEVMRRLDVGKLVRFVFNVKERVGGLFVIWAVKCG